MPEPRWRRDGRIYRDSRTEATIQKDGTLWRRDGGGWRARGWYPTLRDAKAGRGGRRVWRQYSPSRYRRIDGWEVYTEVRRGAPRCWRLRDPAGQVLATLPGGRSNIFGKAERAMRLTPRMLGADRGDRAGRRGSTTKPIDAQILAAADRTWRTLASVREQVIGSRADVDAELRKLHRDRRIHLVPNENSKDITAADERAAIRLGGQDRHLIRLHR